MVEEKIVIREKFLRDAGWSSPNVGSLWEDPKGKAPPVTIHAAVIIQLARSLGTQPSEKHKHLRQYI